MRNPAGRITLALLLASALAGCLGRTPKPSYYTLGAAAPVAAEPVASLPALGLVVGPIDFPRYLDRPELVTRDGAHGLVLSNARRWAGSFRNDFGRVLADQLGRQLGTAHVATYPNEARFPVDYRVQLELVSFEGTLGEPVTLRARWVVADGSGGTAAAAEESEIVEPTASSSWDDLLAAHGRAVSRLATEIATRVASLAAHRSAH